MKIDRVVNINVRNLKGRKNMIRRIILNCTRVLLFCALIGFAAEAGAGSRLYILPQIGTGTLLDPIRPKYVNLCTSQSNIRYGYQPLALVAAACSPDAELFISQQADVFVFPMGIDVKLTGLNVASLTGTLSFLNIPVDSSMDTETDWRTIARQIVGVFLYMQRLKSMVGDRINFDDQIPLRTRFNQLDPIVRQGMKDAAVSLGFSDEVMSKNETLEVILLNFAGQWKQRTFQLNDLTL
jgi:hypothetical protein